MRVVLVVTFAVVLASVSGRATAQAVDVVTLRAALSGFEDVPPAAYWQRLGPRALPTLIALYQDANERPYVRLRAIAAAAHFPSPAARTFLRAVAARPGQSDLFVREALLALARAFGASALDDVSPYLAHREQVVREAAVRALRIMDTPTARAALSARGPLESSAVIRELIDEYVRTNP